MLDALALGRAPGWSATRGAGTCSCIWRPRCRSACTAALAVDLLGGVGDGGADAFEAELAARTPKADRDRAMELDEQAMSGEGTEENVRESLRLALAGVLRVRPEDDADAVLSGPRSRPTSGLWESLNRRAPAARGRAARHRAVPFAFLARARSPMPADQAAGATARAIPGARLDVVDGAGHFPWFEHPGCVRAALDRLSLRVRPLRATAD